MAIHPFFRSLSRHGRRRAGCSSISWRTEHTHTHTHTHTHLDAERGVRVCLSEFCHAMPMPMCSLPPPRSSVSANPRMSSNNSQTGAAHLFRTLTAMRKPDDEME
jgi:hypothetical protein